MRSSIRHLIVGFFALLAVLVPAQFSSAFNVAKQDWSNRVVKLRTAPGNVGLIVVTPTILRREPCDTCAIVIAVPAGASVTGSATGDGAWWLATYDGLKGYIARAHTVLAAEAPLANIHQPRAPATAAVTDRSNAVFIKHVVNASRLNVRAGPGTDYPIRTQLAEGDELRVLGEEFGWYRIMLNGELAFVRSQYVTQQIAVRNNFVEPVPVAPGPCQTSKDPNPASCLKPR